MLHGGAIAVNGAAERAANRRNAAGDVGVVNRRSVPCIGGYLDGFGRDAEVATTLSRSYGNRFVEKLEETFDSNKLMVVAEAGVAREIKDFAHSFEVP